jgi:branched-chain amino acid transport system permease protein
MGGLESIPGVLVAGPIVGVIEQLTALYIDPLVGGGLMEVIPFIVLIIVILVLPYGIFGLKRIERI